MKRKFLSFLILILIVSGLSGLQFVPSVKALPTITLWNHRETVTIGGLTYALLKEFGADSSYTQNQISLGSLGYKLFYKWVYQLTGKAGQAISGTVTYYFYAMITGASSALCHGNVEILIRKTDGTVRATLVAKEASGNTANFDNAEFVTVSGSVAIPDYTIVDETDYLEFDFYGHVTRIQAGKYGYVRYDDSTYAAGDQMRITNIVFSEAPTSEERSFSFTETMKPSASLNQWQEHSRLFIETIIIGANTYGWQEHVYVFQQTITHSGTVTYWQEQIYEFVEITTPSDVLSYWVESAYLFFEYSFTETIHSSAMLNQWQEQVYTIVETLQFSATLFHWEEMTMLFFEFVETIHATDIFFYEIFGSIIDYIALALGGLGFLLSFLPLVNDDEKTKALGAVALILCLSSLAFSILGFNYAFPIALLGFVLALASMALVATKKD